MKEGRKSGQATAVGDWATKRIFTTGEAATICKVSQQTIIRCFDAGRLQGFRVPGSKFRRIPRDELIRFMRANDSPTTILESPTGLKRVLVVDDEPKIIEVFRDIFARDNRFIVETAATGYDAGLLTESFRPNLIILDYMLPDINGNVVLQRLKSHPELATTKVLCVSGVVNENEIQSLMDAGASDFLRKPFRIDELYQKIERLLEMEPRPSQHQHAS